MFRRALSALVWLGLMLPAEAAMMGPVTPAQHEAREAAANANTIGMITGGATASHLNIASDIAQVTDASEALRVLPIVGRGSAQNITDLLYLRGVDAAIVQADVLAHIRENGLHHDIDKRIQYITKLFNEEVHLVAGRNVATIADLEGRRVNLGPETSGARITGKALFQALNVNAQFTSLTDEAALVALQAGEIDALLTVATAPDPLLMRIEAKDGLHLMPIGFPDALGADYVPATIGPALYPALMRDGKPVETIAVGLVMAVFAWPRGSDRAQRLEHFIGRFFDRFDALLAAPHHPRWREVNLAARMPGWTRNPAAEQWLDRNAGASSGAGQGALMQKFIDWQNSGQP